MRGLRRRIGLFNALGTTDKRALTRSMAPIRAGCHMDEVTGLDRFEPVPDTAWHDVRVARPKENFGLDAHRPLVTVVEDQFHRSAHDVQELVTVRVDLTTMRSWSIDVGDRSDCVSIDSPGRSRRGRCDGHRPVATDVRNAPFEVDWRRVRGSSHAHRLPDPRADGQSVHLLPSRHIDGLGELHVSHERACHCGPRGVPTVSKYPTGQATGGTLHCCSNHLLLSTSRRRRLQHVSQTHLQVGMREGESARFQDGGLHPGAGKEQGVGELGPQQQPRAEPGHR